MRGGQPRDPVRAGAVKGEQPAHVLGARTQSGPCSVRWPAHSSAKRAMSSAGISHSVRRQTLSQASSSRSQPATTRSKLVARSREAIFQLSPGRSGDGPDGRGLCRRARSHGDARESAGRECLLRDAEARRACRATTRRSHTPSRMRRFADRTQQRSLARSRPASSKRAAHRACEHHTGGCPSRRGLRCLGSVRYAGSPPSTRGTVSWRNAGSTRDSKPRDAAGSLLCARSPEPRAAP